MVSASLLWILSAAFREESEPRPLRELLRPSSRDTTESKSSSPSQVYSSPRLTNDFHINKRIIDDIAVVQSKRLRNKIAGKLPFFLLSVLRRFHHPHDEENPEGTRQGHLSEVARRGEREKDGLHPREIRAPGRELGNQGQRRQTVGQGSRS